MEYTPSYSDSIRFDIRPSYADSLMHHGIKGMHWGVRRYQNADGSLTPEGKKHYNQSKAFIKGTKNKWTNIRDHNKKALSNREKYFDNSPASQHAKNEAKRYIEAEDLFLKRLDELNLKGKSFKQTKKEVKKLIREMNRETTRATIQNPYVL